MPTTSSSSGSLDEFRSSRRITSLIHSLRAWPNASECSVTSRCSSCVSFTVTGHTLLTARSASELLAVSASRRAMKHLKFSGAPTCT